MRSSTFLYHWFVRPRWSTAKYIHQPIRQHFNLNQKFILDFGSGTGANCCLAKPQYYIGIEPDEFRVQFSKRKYPNYNFHVFSKKEILLPDKSVDCVLIVAVLHHISTKEISDYVREFRRILKPGGFILVMEPYLCKHHWICNRFMQWYDKGNFIRNEYEYLKLFQEQQFDCRIIKKFPKLFLYNELFFQAVPIES